MEKSSITITQFVCACSLPRLIVSLFL